ncbi:hypothetical protein [Streptomyces sioyaensis]
MITVAIDLAAVVALAVGAWAIETRLAALWRAEQRRAAARRRTK